MKIIIGIMLGLLVAVLVAGVLLMARGGDANRKYGNKLMVARVAIQALIVLLLGAMFLIGK